jgi:hypothetical protein
MMSDEVAEIFILFIFGLIFTFVSWRALTLNEITYRYGRYSRKDNPFEFWFYTSLYVFFAVLLILGGIGFSIYLLCSSWR